MKTQGDITKVIQEPISCEEYLNRLYKRVREVLENETYIDKNDANGIGYEIYCDYRDELGSGNLVEISRSDNPQEAFDEIMSDMCINAEDYYYPDLIEKLETEMGDEYYKNADLIQEWVNENVYWYMPENHFNTNVDVVISLDVGDLTYDFTKCNLLNFYSSWTYEPELEETSPIRWLAEQQGKLKEVEDMLNNEWSDEPQKLEYDRFTKSIKRELVNACSHMNTLIFLVSMPLFDFIKLRELILGEKELNNSYTYSERKGEKTFTVSKNSMCGMYDVWGGGGSVLEIELDKDVVIPTKAVFDVWIDCHGSKANGRGYDVDDVYGMTREAWKGTCTITSIN